MRSTVITMVGTPCDDTSDSHANGPAELPAEYMEERRSKAYNCWPSMTHLPYPSDVLDSALRGHFPRVRGERERN